MSSIKWVKFFTDAGLPDKLAAKYAVIFNDHRIQQDMLKDLNKEYLADMGIKTMGDVIAILRHSKEVDDEFNKAKVLAHESTSPKNTKRLATKAPVVKQTETGLSARFSGRLGPHDKVKRAIDSEDENSSKIKKLIRYDDHDNETPTPRRTVQVAMPKVRQGNSGLISSTSAQSKQGVFGRLGGGSNPSTNSTTERRVIKLNNSPGASRLFSEAMGTQKVTATVRPLAMPESTQRAITGNYQANNSVRNRLGVAGAAGVVTRGVVGSNLRTKTNNSNVSSVKRTVSTKSSIFDRLGMGSP